MLGGLVGDRVLRTIRRQLWGVEWDARVEKEKLRLPPSGLKPVATAIASSKVDLPGPFSPTTKVTLGCRSTFSIDRIRGSEYGYVLKSGTSSRSSITRLTNGGKATTTF